MFSSFLAADLTLLGVENSHHPLITSANTNSIFALPSSSSSSSSSINDWTPFSADYQQQINPYQPIIAEMEPSMIGGAAASDQQSPTSTTMATTEAGIAGDSDSTMDDSFGFGELEPRGRCYTWPVPQPSSSSAFATTGAQAQDVQQLLDYASPSCSSVSSSRFPSLNSILAIPSDPIHQQQLSASSSTFLTSSGNVSSSVYIDAFSIQQELCGKPKPKRVRRRTADGGGPAAAANQSHKKPNPWGEESYSDLIARALACSADGRLKLNEIYQWFSDNIPYFGQRSSQEEAQGWKVHNIAQ